MSHISILPYKLKASDEFSCTTSIFESSLGLLKLSILDDAGWIADSGAQVVCRRGKGPEPGQGYIASSILGGCKCKPQKAVLPCTAGFEEAAA